VHRAPARDLREPVARARAAAVVRGGRARTAGAQSLQTRLAQPRGRPRPHGRRRRARRPAGPPGRGAKVTGSMSAVSPVPERAALARARRGVIKVGSRLVAESPVGRPAAIAAELAALRDRPLEAVIVSSGAIALGRRVLGMARRPHALPVLQAAAAAGQTRRMHGWEEAFAVHRLTCAQVLLTRDDLAGRRRCISARDAVRAVLEAGAVPVINESDTV